MEANEILIRLMKTAKEIEGFDFFMGKAELTKTEFRLLREVVLERRKGGEIIASELARRLSVTRSAISQIINKLEAKEIVTRIPSKTDKKIAYVRLSDAAEAAFEKHCACANNFMREVVSKFGKERMKQFIAEFDDLIQIMAEIKSKCGDNQKEYAETTGN